MSVATVAALRVPASLARFSHRAGRRASRAARHPLSVRAVGKDPSPEEEDDLPEPIKLTPEQAKVAALAFELLYEKDPVEELEDMLVDRERPELRAKLQRAIEGARPDTSTAREGRQKISLLFSNSDDKAADPFPFPPSIHPAANEACKLGATIECAAAWEEVDGLEDAAMRAGMSQNAPSSEASSPPKAKSQIPKIVEKKKSSSDAKADVRMSNPATRAGTDPLAGMNPCGAGECEVPQGTFQARMDLERAMAGGGAVHEDDEALTDQIRDAVDVAISLCEQGASAGECAVAWDVVEELSSAKRMKKRKRDDKTA